MSRKIAVITSGAVSLGSYEAGVLYELFEIFRVYAEQWIEDGNCIDDIDFEVDVLAGASAGSVNSVIYGLAAVYNPALISAMKDVWLDGLDISKLMGQGSFSRNSIFSDAEIRRLKKRIIGAVGAPLAGPLPARMKVGLTLANLSGIPYMVSFPHLKDKSYKLTTFADWQHFDLVRGGKDDKQIENMFNAAVASAAFPFAFPACTLRRSRADYAGTALPDNGKEIDFVYVDGGIFNNEPVNRAKELALAIGSEYGGQAGPQGGGMSDRIYLLVDPTPPEESPEFDTDPDMAAVGQRLVTAILSEAHFRDWNDAVKINQRISWQDRFLLDMYAHFSGMESRALGSVLADLSRTAGRMVDFKVRPIHEEKMTLDEPGLAGKREAYRLANEERIWQGWRERLENVREERRDMPPLPERNSDLGRAIVNFVFVMECIGALRAKVSLDIRPVFPDNGMLLAGKFWGSFGGFLCRDLREHDFNVGRLTARKFVKLSEDEGGLALNISGIESRLPPIPPISGGLKGSIEDVPLECRVAVRNRLIAGVDKVLSGFIKRNWHFIAGILAVFCIAVAALETAFRHTPLAVIGVLVLLLGITDVLIRTAVKSRLKKELNKQFRI